MKRQQKNSVEIMDYKIVSHSRPMQAAVRLKTPTGWTNRIRLKDAYGQRLLLPDDKSPEDMGIEFMTRCHIAVARLAQDSVEQETFRTPNRRFRNCKQAMDKFVAECARDHHHNSFVEYYGDKPLSSVNRTTVTEFVGWLMHKYAANEQTVSKKVFAGSSLFKWMKKKGWWLGENPFSEALSGVKFAPAKQKKDIIEPDELARFMIVLQDERYHDLRILVEILYCTGMRPSEAIAVLGEKLEEEHISLHYLRTKRKNKTPDWRRIPVPSRLISLLVNEGRTKGPVVNLSKYRAQDLMREAADIAQIGGLTLETFRKDFSYRARLAGASVDDVNLYQGRQETILEKHYTTNQWFICQQCRWWVDKMFGDKPGLQVVR